MGDAGTSKTLVLLEDDPLQLQVLDLQLQAEGLAPRGCLTAEEALQQIAAAAPGPLTLLMDIQMPQMQPVEFCRQVRALFPTARIVGCSASQPAAQVLAAFDHFVLKPATGRVLADAAFPQEGRTSGAKASKESAARLKPSSSASLDSQPLVHLNADTFENLARSMSPALLRSLYAAYFKDADQRLRDMESAHAQADASGMKRSAHTLKGSSGMLGVQSVAQAAFAMETVDSTAKAPQLLSDLRQRLARARLAINQKLDTLTPDVAIVPSTTDSPTALLRESKHTQ